MILRLENHGICVAPIVFVAPPNKGSFSKPNIFISSAWEDYDFKNDVAIYDHIAEFERVTSFGEYNTKERIALWKEKNDEAHKLYDEQKRVTIWDLLREFSQILENDEYRAIENIGKSGSFSDEDLADYIDELTEAFLYSKKYNKWLHRFNRLVRGIENDTEIY